MQSLNDIALLTRRSMMEVAARSLLGVTLLPALDAFGAKPDDKPKETAAKGSGSGPGRAKHVIYLFMSGAMSHIDTFDLKPGKAVQGETKGIQTNVPGM